MHQLSSADSQTEHGPEPPSAPDEAERKEREPHRTRYDDLGARMHRERDVSAIELGQRKQVEGRNENADPSRHGERTHLHHSVETEDAAARRQEQRVSDENRVAVESRELVRKGLSGDAR